MLTCSAVWLVCASWEIPRICLTSTHCQIRVLRTTLTELRYLDVPNLISWLCARQQAPIGGVGGRANKLVDGCYSHWIGGCFALVEAAIRHTYSEGVWNREALQRYILCCAQGEKGGLRDKPGMQVGALILCKDVLLMSFRHVDPYHTCYVLAGLSSAQHTYAFSGPVQGGATDPIKTALGWSGSSGASSAAQATGLVHQVLMTSLDSGQHALHRFTTRT